MGMWILVALGLECLDVDWYDVVAILNADVVISILVVGIGGFCVVIGAGVVYIDCDVTPHTELFTTFNKSVWYF